MIHRLLVLVDGGQPPQLNFLNHENASAARRTLLHASTLEGVVEVADDYGIELSIAGERIFGALVSNISAELEGQAEVAILQSRAQMMAQRRAQAEASGARNIVIPHVVPPGRQ